MEVLKEIGEKIGFDWQLAVIHFVNFAIIFFLLVRYAFPGIKRVIDERTQKIKEGLQLREDSEKLIEVSELEAKEIIKDSSHKASTIIEKAQLSATTIINTAQDKSKVIISEAQIEKENALQNGLHEAENLLKMDINKILSAISDQAFSKNLSERDNSEFVEKTFKQVYGK